jgi:hypothetical protein
MVGIMKMKRLALLALVSMSATGTKIAAAQKSLEDSINDLLRNNCRGAGSGETGFSGGLFSDVAGESDFERALLSTSTVREQDGDISVFDLDSTVDVGGIETQEDVDPNSFTVATNDDGTPFRLTTPSVWFDEDLLIIDLNAGDQDPDIDFNQGDVARFISEEDLPPGTPSAFFPRFPDNDADFSQTFEIRLDYTDTTTSVNQLSLRDDIAVGAGLRDICTGRETMTTTADFQAVARFAFNGSGGLGTAPGTPSSFGSTSSLTLSNTSGAGLTPSGDFDAVKRLDQSHSASLERLRRKADAERRREDRPRRRDREDRNDRRERGGEPVGALQSFQVASLSNVSWPQSATSSTRAQAPSLRRFTFVTDLSAGAVNIDRAPTALEGGYDADSFFVNGAAALVFHGQTLKSSSLMLGGSVTYEETESNRVSTSGSNGTSRTGFESESLSGAVVAAWTSAPLGAADGTGGRLNAEVRFGFGDGEQSYVREFTATFEEDSDRAAVSDALGDAVDQDFSAVSLAAQFIQPLGKWTLTPRVRVSWVEFNTDAHEEEALDGENNGLALRYEAVSDEWVETRVGSSLDFTDQFGNGIEWSAGVGFDAVFVGDAETPERTAFFAQDLRGAGAVPIVYSVDDLDSEYYDVNLRSSLRFANGVQLFGAAFTRQGHDYLDLTGGLVGIRLSY